jgi:hypothetical protein
MAKSPLKSINLLSLEDHKAIYRLTEQAQALLEVAQSLPKSKTQVEKAQQICDDIRKILHNPNETIVGELFEVTIAPRLVRLAQELKVQKAFNSKNTIKRVGFSPILPQTLPKTVKKEPKAEKSKEMIHSILHDLTDMLK